MATNLSWDLVGGGDPGNVLQGSQLIFKATLKNQGNSYSNKLRTVGFQVNSVTETWKNTGASAMQPFTFVTDVASNGPNGRIYWTVPNSPHVNEYVARVVIDGSANSIPESDETNNDLLTVKLLPNLDITDVSFDGGLPLTMASTDKFTAKVVNAGRIATLGGVNAFRVKFFVDDQAIGASNWHTVAVPPGGSVSLKSPNWTPASTGHHKFRAEIELGTHGGLALLDANLLDNVFNRGNVNGVQDGLWVHP